MRITSSMYYDNVYGTNNSKLSQKLFDVNKQIASGLNIQYAQDDVTVFTQTMKLDNEIATLSQIKKSTQSGYKTANQTDLTLNEFDTTLTRIKTLLVSTANATNSNASLDATASELRGLESHLKNLANTSINGQYLFSGSAVDIKPIRDDGKYMGNDVALNAFIGSRTQQQYNLSGADLFLGEDILMQREITSNVVQKDLSAKYPNFEDLSIGGTDAVITSQSTIRDLMGDMDNIIDDSNEKHHFYIQGVTSGGISFNEKISLKDTDTVDNFLTLIGNAYGNTPQLKMVNVSLNNSGEIVIQDIQKGSSKLDFHMVGAVDFNQTDFNDAADVSDPLYAVLMGKIDNLDAGEKDFDKIINGTSTAINPNLHVKEFIKSDFTPASGAATNIDGLLYDRTQFSKNGSLLSSSVPQIIKDTNAFATASTKISEVADLTQETADSLDATQLKLTGQNIYGVSFDVQIDFKNTANGGSTFSLDGGLTNYDIFNVENPRIAVDADQMSYRQMMDVMNMVITDQLPAPIGTHTHPDTTPFTAAEEYDEAIKISNLNGNTYLSDNGKIEFGQVGVTTTKATIALYDVNSGNFTPGSPTSVMTFNSNNALSVRDPKTDFFKTIDEIITAVENHKVHPDAQNGDARNVGIQNSIKMIDDLLEHVSRAHASVGAQSNSLTNALDRTTILEVSTMTLRSSIIDTDVAEASLSLTQLSLNYEAMLSTVGKISKLSLVNYL